MPRSKISRLVKLALTCSLLHEAAPGSVMAEELTGATWDIVIIEAGRSLNGDSYPAEVLRAAGPLFEGVPIFAYQLGKTLGHADENAAEEVDGKGFSKNLVGQITDVRWDERRRALVGKAQIDDEATRTVLIRQWKRSGKTMLGLSIDAEGLKGEGEEVGRLVRANSVDLVTFPAAGGRFLRLVASTYSEVQLLEGRALGRFLQSERERRGLTLEEAVSRGFARSASTLGQIERGTIGMPPDDVLRSLADMYDVSLERLRELSERDDLVECLQRRFLEQERFTAEPWDGSAARFSIEELGRAVPRAVLSWARRRAEQEERDVTKADLKLPYREPDGRVNVSALRAVLAVLGGARGGVDLPEDVQNSAREEVRGLLDEWSRRQRAESSEETEVAKIDLASLDAQIKNLVAQRMSVLREQAPAAFSEIMGLAEQVLVGPAADWPEEMKAPLARILELAKQHAMAEGVGTEDELPPASIVAEAAPAPIPAIDQNPTQPFAAPPVPAAPIPAAPIAAAVPTPAAPAALVPPVQTSHQNTVPVPAASPMRQVSFSESPELAKLRAEAEAQRQAAEAGKKKFRDLAIKQEMDRACEELNIVDHEAAAVLMDASDIKVDESSGQVSGLREALDKLIEARPYLVKKKEAAPTVQLQESIIKNGSPAGILTSRMDELKSKAATGDLRAMADYRVAVRQARENGGTA